MTTADHDLPSFAPLDYAAPLPLPLAVSPAPPPPLRLSPRTGRSASWAFPSSTSRGSGRSNCWPKCCRTGASRPAAVYFVNAHTLNLAASDAAYRDVLAAGDCVFGDGTGVRWAAPLQGVRLHDNLVGTDLTPQLLRAATRLRPPLFPPRRRAAADRAGRRRGRRGLSRLDPGRLPSRLLPRPPIDRRGHPPHQPVAGEPAPGGHGQSAPGAMDSPASPAAGGSAVSGRGRAVPLLGRRSSPAPPWLRRLRGRMAGHSLPAAAEGPPLSARQSALPLAGDSFARDRLTNGVLSPAARDGRFARDRLTSGGAGASPVLFKTQHWRKCHPTADKWRVQPKGTVPFRSRCVASENRDSPLSAGPRPPCPPAAKTRYYPDERRLPGRGSAPCGMPRSLRE